LKPAAASRPTTLALLVLACVVVSLASSLGAALGCRPARGEPDDLDGSLGEPERVAVAPRPVPVASDTQDCLALVGSDGWVYSWVGNETWGDLTGPLARRLYRPEPGWEVSDLTLSPHHEHPYLGVVEARTDGSGRDTRVTVVDLSTGEAARLLPAGDYTPTVTGLQWSSDGTRLLALGRHPLVLDLSSGPREARVSWDLRALSAADSEARRPLAAPDFSVVAFTRFYLSADQEEDLWVLEAGRDDPRRVTAGGLGAYPQVWLGAHPDGSDPDGPFDWLLVRLGAIGTGGGSPGALAAVDIRTGEVRPWSDDDAVAQHLALLDLGEGRALLGQHQAMTGADARVLWRCLREGTAIEVDELAGRLLGWALEAGTDGPRIVALASEPESGARELWLLGPDGEAERLGTFPAQTQVLPVGTLRGHAYAATVTAEADGRERTALLQVDTTTKEVREVTLWTAAGR